MDFKSISGEITLKSKIGVGILSLSCFFTDQTKADELFSLVPELTNVSLPSEVKTTFQALNEKECFRMLSPEQKDKAVSIYDDLPPSARDCFLYCFNNQGRGDNQFIILSKDFKGKQLVDRLFEICANKFHPVLEPYREKILISMLSEVTDPRQLNQGNYAVCGTSVVYPLYKYYPAEAVRLLQGLLSDSGQVNFLQDGKILNRSPFSLILDLSDKVSITELIMFSAVMEFGNGPREHYCSVCDQNYNLQSGEMMTGLALSGQLNVLKALYNLSDDECYFVRGADSFESYKSKYLPGYLPAVLKWREEPISSLNLISRHRLNLDNMRAVDHFYDVRLNDGKTGSLPANSGNYDSLHEITVLRIENGRVYYHNLHGPNSSPNGTELPDPPRRVEDCLAGIESMAYKEFISRLRSFIVPHNNHKIPVPRIKK